MSIYDVMIKNNIKGFLSWLKTNKKVDTLPTGFTGILDSLIDEYLEETYSNKGE